MLEGLMYAQNLIYHVHAEGDGMLDVLLDAALDGLKVMAIAFLIYFILAFFTEKWMKVLHRNSKAAPLFGSLVGLIPQCGVPVVGADLYLKRRITTGTIIAIFLACSDEALPVLIGSEKWYMIFPLLGIKIVLGFLVGTIVDLFIHDELDDTVIISDEDKHSKLHHYLIHPLLDALKVFAYVFIINFLFGTMIHFIGEENILNFLKSNMYLSPIFTILLGIIPNCAPSLLMSELYIMGGIPFGALLAGLSVNAGLGFIFLLKNSKMWKRNLLILGILVLASILVGYGFIWI